MPDTHLPPRPADPSLVLPPSPDTRVLRSDEEALGAARDFADSIASGAASRDRDRVLPFAEFDRFSALGLGGVTVPRAFGGPDVSFATLAEIVAIISAADPNLGQLPQNHLAFLYLLRVEPDRDKQARYFDLALRGYRFGNALAEFTTKTTRDMATRITPDGDGFRINGRKFYSTAALYSHFIPVGAVDGEGRGFRIVLPRDAPGLTIIDDWSSFGQRLTASGTVLLEDVRAEADWVIPSHLAVTTPSLYGPVSQIIQAAIDLGIARAAISDTIEFVRRSSRPWIDAGVERASDDPYTIAAIGRLQIDLHAAEALLTRAGHILDESEPNQTDDSVARSSIAVAEAKVLTTELAIAATNKLFELAGTRATLAEHGLDRHWRNARTHTLHDPVRWKFHAIGNYALNGVRPPRHSWI